MYFFDPKNDAFLVNGVHDISNDCIEISDDEYFILLSGRNNGCQIYVDGGKVKISEPSPSQYHKFDGKKWVIDDAKKEQIKLKKQELMRQKINAHRDKKNASGVWVEALGHWFDSDADAQRRLSGLSATVADISKVNPDLAAQIAPDWTDAENKTVKSLNQEKRAYIMLAIMEMEQKNHEVANQHKENMLKLDNPEEYDFSGGWAKNYKDSLEEVNNGK